MEEKCICETGEEKHYECTPSYLADITLSVYFDNGDWMVSVHHPDNYAPCEYGPIFYCPLCGREL